MALAGIESFAVLAQLIHHEGLGERTLRKIADDNDKSRTPQRLDLLAIAQACGLPEAFFAMDFWEAAGALEMQAQLVRRADAVGPEPGQALADERVRLSRLQEEFALAEARMREELERRLEVQGEELDRKIQEIVDQRLPTDDDTARGRRLLDMLVQGSRLEKVTLNRLLEGSGLRVTEADANTRDEEDASSEGAPTPSEEKQRDAQRRAR